MKTPKTSAWDFMLGHRFCTYDDQGRAVLHTSSEVSAMKAPEPWAYDWKRRRWIKRPTERGN
jgi:hypothetical protein